MTRMAGLIHESREERKNKTLEIFQKGVLPVFGVSCTDGILLVATSSRPGVSKIGELLERVAIAGTGNLSDFKKIYLSSSSHAKVQAYVYLSSGDMRIVEDLQHMLSMEFRQRFRNLYSTDYFECELLIATLGFNQKEDSIFAINFTGSTRIAKENLIRIPNIDYSKSSGDKNESIKSQTKKIDLEENRAIEEGITTASTMRESLKTIREIINKFRGANSAFLEVAILSREEAQAKRFRKVYKKLSAEELSAWLA